jgi:extracellular factor (EF) 3-hydroxypalmitic acid methyl ester biosynthesis protein
MRERAYNAANRAGYRKERERHSAAGGEAAAGTARPALPSSSYRSANTILPVQSIRQIDPVITFRNSQGDPVRGTLTSLQRRALVMEIYNPYSIVQISEVLSELVVRAGDQRVYEGKAVVVSLVNTGLMAVASVTLTDEWNELATMGREPGNVMREATRFVEDWTQRFRVRRDYQVVVSEMRAYFSEITRWVDQADVVSALPREGSGRIREDIFMELAAPLLHKGRDYLQWFEGEALAVEPELAVMHRSFAQAAIHPLILRAPFVWRTYAKPLGYAGDYEMVNQILGDPRQGPSTYFQLVNYMFLQAGVAQAHRNRIDILVERLMQLARQGEAAGRPMRVLNVGCGPAVEIVRLLQTTPLTRWLDFTLVDFSEETLEYTRTQLEAAARAAGHELHLTLQHESVNQLLKRASRVRGPSTPESFDFVYCAGLFDYLSDKVCNRLIAYFVSRCRDGAAILVTNVHAANPERLWMEHFLEWYLIYRDEGGLLAVLPEGLRDARTWTDATGVNVFLEAAVSPRNGPAP